MPLLDLLFPTESGRNLSASGGRLTNSYLNFSTKRIGHEGSHAVVGRLTNNLIKFPLMPLLDLCASGVSCPPLADA